jgi:O-antigen/teichoic acid export membrane protein
MLGALVLEAADRLMVNAHLGRDETARYQVAYNIGSLPMLVLGMLTAVWMPRFFAVEDAGHRDAVLVASRDALYRLLCPVMVGMAVASPVLLRIWAPPAYRTDELLLLTAVIVVSAAPYTAGMSANRVLLTRTSTRVIAWAALVASVVNIGLNLVLVPVWGLLGAAVATFVSYAAQWALLARPAALPRLRSRLHRRPWVQTGVVCTAAVLTVLLPLGAAGLAVRMVLAVGCLAWFGWQLRRTASGAATG